MNGTDQAAGYRKWIEVRSEEDFGKSQVRLPDGRYNQTEGEWDGKGRRDVMED